MSRMRQFVGLLTGVVLLLAAGLPAPATAQRRPAGMDTDEFGNLKRSTDWSRDLAPRLQTEQGDERRLKGSKPRRQRFEKPSGK